MSAPSSALPLRAEGRSGRLHRWWRALRFRDVVVLSALPLLVLALLLGDAALRLTRTIQFDDWWSVRGSVPGFFSERVHALITLPERVALRQRLNPDQPDAGIIRLDVPGGAWDAGLADPLVGWGSWVNGTLKYGGTTIDVRLRKRGDNSIHWLTDKRTLTIRTPRDEFYKGYRAFAFSVKDVLPSYLANRLAPEFGLLAPATEVVPVFLGNQFYGMFRLIEVVDESFLRPFDRMPGNIFRGDAAERGDAHKGVDRNLFDNPYLWDRVATNDRWTSAGAGQLGLLLADLRGGTFADHQRLMGRLDRNDLARLFAYLLVVGDPFHMDRVHNQFLYEDPSTQRLHLIPWDIRLLDLRRPERTLNDLFQAVFRDPFLVDQVMAEVDRAINERRIDAVAESLATAAETRYREFFRYDRLRVGLVPDVGTAAQAAGVVHSNVRELRRWLETDSVGFQATATAGSVVLDFETRGLVGVDLTALELGSVGGTRVRLYRDLNLNGVLDAGDADVPIRAEPNGRVTLSPPLALLPGWRTDRRGVIAGRVPYRLFLTGVAGTAVRPVLRNRVRGTEVQANDWAAGSVILPPTGWHPWRYPVRRPAVHRLSGTAALATTLTIPAGDTLVIEPGTTLRLGPDVSMVSEGLVRAVGTASRPIRFVPADSDRPWGTFSLVGSGASGSVIRNVEFVSGGGALVDRIEFIGMVNVHRATGVVFDSVLFRANRRSDDTFHALHAVVSLTRSRFVEANSDAVDFDISGGEIRDNVFEGSGGDAIDLMTSTPRIIGNRIRRAGDKGISIGEASSPLVFNNLIEESPIGIEIKDRSAPIILNNEIRRTGIGLRSRMKNWRYGGSGFGTVVNTALVDVRVRLDLDSLARLTTVGTVGVDSPPSPPSPPSPAAGVAWLYAANGIAVDSVKVGLAGAWHSVVPRPALEVERFRDDFSPVADGWTGGARVTRLEKRRDALVVEVEGGTGVVSRPASWDLEAGGGTLVLELTTRDIRSGRVVAVGSRGETAVGFGGGDASGRFRMVECLLPPDRYHSVRIELEPTPGLSHVQRSTGLSVVRAGRLDVRSLAVYPGRARPRAP